METIRKLKPTKELWIKIRWILSHAKPIIPFLIFSIVLNVIFSLIGIYNVIVSKSLIDSAIGGNSQDVIKWLIIMISLTLFSMLSSPITSFISTHTSIKFNQSIQRKIYRHVEYSEWLNQSHFHSVNLISRITSDVSNISSALLNTIPNLVSLFVTLIGSFYTLIYWAPSIAIVAVFIGPFLILIGRIFSSKLKDLYKQSQEADIKYRAFMQESIQNIMIVKTFCMEKRNIQKLNGIQDTKYKIAMKNTKFSVLTSLSMNFCSNLAYFAIFCWGILNIAKRLTTYGTFTGMLQLYSKVQVPFSSLASMVPGFISTIAAAERLMEIEALPLEEMHDTDSTNNLTKPEVEFKNVTFGYTDSIKTLDNVNLKIPYGETLAFVGPSGEGKTTLIKLILSLIKPTKGQIILNENNLIEKLNRNHRNLISYVPQGNTLFSGTIEENLRYGNPNASEDEIVYALRAACAFDFVNELQDGINTTIGERGVGLSEGQAQRIAIARSFLRKRPILILDEATSALDPETEVNVLNAIKALSHKPTCIIITHRPSALNICSRIIKLTAGEVSEVNRKSILEVASELV